jgi:hypothetical protein
VDLASLRMDSVKQTNRLKSGCTSRLYDYLAHYWGYHANEVSASCQSVIEFLEDAAKVEALSQALLAVKRWSSDSDYSQRVPRQMTGLHIAAYFGFQKAVNALLGGQRSDLRDSYGRTPLSWAAEKGHEAVAKLLLEKGAELETKDTDYGLTPLSWAAQYGYESVDEAVERGQGVGTTFHPNRRYSGSVKPSRWS